MSPREYSLWFFEASNYEHIDLFIGFTEAISGLIPNVWLPVKKWCPIWYGPYHMGHKSWSFEMSINQIWNQPFIPTSLHFFNLQCWHTLSHSGLDKQSVSDLNRHSKVFPAKTDRRKNAFLRFIWDSCTVSFQYSEYDIIYIGFIVNSVLIFNQGLSQS